MKRIELIVSSMLIGAAMYAQTMESPNGNIKAEAYGSGIIVTYKGATALDIPALGIGLDDKKAQPTKITAVSQATPIDEAYTMLVGKELQCSNQGNAYTLTCTPVDKKPLSIEMRVYNDGIAYRYVLDKLKKNIVSDELTTYVIPEGTNRWLMKHSQAYEDFFPLYTTGATNDLHFGYPALIEPTAGTFVLLSESDMLKGHSASSLDNSNDKTKYRVVGPQNTAKFSGRWVSPWRVAIIGTLPEVVESNLVNDVATPSKLADTSWIHPGSVSWIYWAYNHGSNDYQIVKKYIDMAAELNLPYVLIDAEWDEMSNGGTIEDALAYAKEKGVKPLIWYNSSTGWTKEWGAPGPHDRLNDPIKRDAEFAKIASMGVAGVKIDFFDGDTSETMDYCIDLLESAAKHKLMVNFHGATIPRGWQRTYPNLMTTEAVYGAEWYNNKPVLTGRAAEHNATLPFTRNVIGSMDYTPCTFSDSQHPHITSNAHELALPVIFESGLLHWADKPESYLAQPEQVKHLISTLPTVWDETRLVGGYPGDYVVMARRSGDTWYVAGISGHDEPVNIDVAWDFLPDTGDTYTVQAFTDGSFGDPWTLNTLFIDKKQLPKTLTLQPRGGFVAVLQKMKFGSNK